MNAQEVFRVPMSLIPSTHLFENIATIWSRGSGATTTPFGILLMNSLVMALVISIGKIAVSILSAYAIVYFRFPFRNTAFWLIFVTLMLPVEVRIFPTVQVVSTLHLTNSYAGLTLPLIASATATFLFRQFFMTLPDELMEAARIDGAGPLRFFWDVVLPLSRTSIAALFVITLHLRLDAVPVAAAGRHRRREDRTRSASASSRMVDRTDAATRPANYVHLVTAAIHADHACRRCYRCGAAMQRWFVRRPGGDRKRTANPAEFRSMAALSLNGVRKAYGGNARRPCKGVSMARSRTAK